MTRLGRAAEPAAGAGGGQARAGALLDDLLLEFGQGAEDVELKTPGRGRGVDLFGQRAKADLAVVQVLDRVDQVFEAAAKPIQAPDHERVAGGEELKAGVELGAMAQGPRADIAKHAPAAGLLERVELQREVLIVRGHARIADQLVAGGPPAPGAATSGRGWALPGRSHALDRLRSLGRAPCEPTPSVRLASETLQLVLCAALTVSRVVS